MVDPHIGKRLKECRQKAGISQTELAQITGMGITAISNIERGSNYPTVDNLITIMKAVDASPNYVFQDVLKPSCRISQLGDIGIVPEAQRRKIMKVLEILLDDQNEEKIGGE